MNPHTANEVEANEIAHTPCPDTQLVERLRRNIATLDRWRWVMIVFYSLLSLAVAGLVVACVELFRGLQQLAGAQGQFLNFALFGFFLGITLGTTLGLIIFKVVDGLLTAIFGFGRTERLLVKYHDALQELMRDPRNAARSN